MHVTAYQIVNTFGIDALGTFWSVENAGEIQRCREEYHAMQNDLVTIKAFNDGNNIFEVIFNVNTFEAWRTDYPGVLLEPWDYLEEKLAALEERERIGKLFGKRTKGVLEFIKYAKA